MNPKKPVLHAPSHITCVKKVWHAILGFLWFILLCFRARERKNHPEMKHLYLVHEMLLQKSKPFPVNSLVYSFVPAFHCSTRYHGKTDLILVISWSWDGNVSSLSSRARKHEPGKISSIKCWLACGLEPTLYTRYLWGSCFMVSSFLFRARATYLR